MKEIIDSNFHLSLEISRWEQETVNNELVFYYQIDMHSEITGIDWTVSKSVKDFQELVKNLSSLLGNIPEIPEITQPKGKVDEIDRTREILESFLNMLISRTDIYTSVILSNFLELENHIKNIRQYQLNLLYEINDLKQEVGDICYSSTEKLLFVGCCYSSSTEILQSCFANLSSMWKNEPLGLLCIYHLKEDSITDSYEVEKLCEENLNCQVSKLHYYDNQKESMIYVALFDGSIEIFQLNVNFRKYVSKKFAEKIFIIKPHKNKIIDIGIDINFGYIYSAAIKEKNIVVSKVNYEGPINSIQITDAVITNFIYDDKNQRIFITDEANRILVLHIEKEIEIFISYLFFNQGTPIISLTVDSERQFIFTGNQKGYIVFYEFMYKDSKYEIEKRLQLKIDDKNSSTKVNELYYNSEKCELIAALSNGTVQFWSHDDTLPEFVHGCHEKKISRILFEQNKKYFFSASEDKTVKIWNLPIYWTSEMTRADTDKNQRLIFEDAVENNEKDFNFLFSRSNNEKISNDTQVKGSDSNEVESNNNFSFNSKEKESSAYPIFISMRI